MLIRAPERKGLKSFWGRDFMEKTFKMAVISVFRLDSALLCYFSENSSVLLPSTSWKMPNILHLIVPHGLGLFRTNSVLRGVQNKHNVRPQCSCIGSSLSLGGSGGIKPDFPTKPQIPPLHFRIIEIFLLIRAFRSNSIDSEARF